ncbi:EXS-domain-containing protein [Gonapodya prolifera JEL478]|uniref:EXS-domain-containing protein n=1 Tax=Gonapodya prolifera (strain JEL478) TaxID=1344416 RepID=A0A139AU88_GONPJ|nr:EXS-domain-containing protein [Gonapodya prolifera JEL478]|eukprot:KXS20269.1 EXS-domain-containing protein [Gonapodya prolifera JEL478]
MTCVPNFLRLIQCIRRFFDTHTIGPHLGNAFKYFLALITIALSFASKFASGDVVRSCWIAIAVSSTIFTMWWDFRMDVGLLTENDKHRWLRSELIYPPWIYYAWMPLNFILRCAWIVVISPSYWQHLGVDGNVVAYVLALLEVVRRGLWLFLRIENEHANNVGHFRATKEIPLPPLSRDERGQRGQNPDFGALRQHVD